MLEKKILIRNLHNADVFIEDTEATSKYFQILEAPQVLPPGRSSILINGSSFLKQNTEIIVELLDTNDDTIYANPIHNVLEGTSRRIGIEVYQSTPPGEATLTVLGEIDPEKVDFVIPEEFVGVYNVRFQKTFTVDPSSQNNVPIHFIKLPQLGVSEKIIKTITPSEGVFGVTRVVSGSLSGRRIPLRESQVVNPASIKPVTAVISAPDINFPTEGVIFNREFKTKLSSVDSTGTIIKRRFDWGDGTSVSSSILRPIPNEAHEEHTYTRAGTYTAKLSVASPTGQSDQAFYAVNISKPPAPSTDFSLNFTTGSMGASTDPNVSGFPIVITDTTQNVTGISAGDGVFDNIVDTEYSWSFGDGTFSNQEGQNTNGAIPINYTYSQTGSYSIHLNVKNAYNTQVSSKTKGVLILPPVPIASFTIDSGSGHFPLVVSASNVTDSGSNPNSSLGGPDGKNIQAVSMSYAWDWGDGTTTAGKTDDSDFKGSGNHRYTDQSSDKTYTITLTATDQYSRSSEVSEDVTPAIASPKAVVTATSASKSYPVTVHFNSAQSTGSAPSHPADHTDPRDWSAGKYLDSTSYYWQFENGDPATSNDANPSVAYSASKSDFTDHIAQLRLVATTGKTDVVEFLVKMEPPQLPAASFTTTTANGFSPLEIEFINGSTFDTTTPATYVWNFGDGNSSADTNPTHTYAAGSETGRVYSPTLTITDGFGQTATFSKDITVKDPTPMANFGMAGGNTDIVIGQSRQFTDLSSTPAETTIASRSWSFTQGSIQQTSTAASPTITFNNAGYVTAKLTVTNSLGISHSKTVVNIFSVGLQKPTANGNLSTTTAYTNLTVVSVTDTSTSNHANGISAVTVNWGDGTGNNTQGPGATWTHTYDTAGSYVVKISAHDSTGTSVATLGTVVVAAPAAPVVSEIRLFGSSTGSKPHEVEAELIVSGTYDTISWSSGDGKSARSRNCIFIYNSLGTKTLSVTATGPGGSSTKTKDITVFGDIFDGDDSDIEDPEPTDDTNTGQGSANQGGGGGGCVLEGTLILTDRGYIPVEEVKLDDKVVSYDFESEEFRDYEIKKAWNKLQPAWCFIETDLGVTLSCSDTHLIYHPDYKHNEIAVRDLVVGEIIYVYKDGKLFKDNVKNITFFEQEKRVYNFSIDDVKSYISDGILSHNERKNRGNDPGGGESDDPYGMNLASPAQVTYEITREDAGEDTGSFWEEDMIGGIVTVPNIRTAIVDSDAIRGLQGPDNTSIVDNATWITADTSPYIFKVLSIEREGWKPGSDSFGQSTKVPSWHPTNSTIGLKGMLLPELGPIVTNRVFETKGTVYKEYMDFAPTEYTMSYTKPVSMSYDVINKQSYAKVALTNMRTFSGQVHRIKIYFKSAGDLGQHGVLFDSPVASADILADEFGHTGYRRLGWFSDQVHVNKYWQGKEGFQAGLHNGNVEGNTIQCEQFQYHSGSLTYTGEFYGNSMMISGANMPENHYVSAYTKDIQGSSAESGSFRLARGVEYALRAKVTGLQKKKEFRLTPTEAAEQGGNQGLQSGPKAKLNFYLTGSAVESDQPWGRKLGWLEVENEPTRSFGIVEQNFTVAKSGDFKLQLVAESGQWHVRDIMIKPAREVGFSPDVFSITAKMPTLPRRPDQLRFFVEFYTADGKLSVKKAILPEFVQFEGDNVVIDGLENIVSGSLHIGSALGSGFEFFGGGSAYLRTVDYEGFTSASLNLARGGFLMWSGSVLPDSGDDYDGVGMEMHDGLGSGSFRFRTNPSELDIRTDKFFFGRDDQFISGANGTIAISSSKFYLGSHTQFVSGADGNIEISSSNFHLSGSGDVTMQGKITATSGDIGGWQLQTTTVNGTERTVLSGSNTTLDGTGAALYMSNKGPDTNKLDGYYIDFSPDDQPPGEQYYVRFGTNFAVREDGQLFASGAKIEGILTASEGFIGGWTIGSGSLYKVQGGKYTGLSTAGDTRFFAGATSLAGSGSGVFTVKNTGDITGSQVLFTGGKIAGATIGNSRLSYGSNWAISASSVDNEVFISSSKFNVKQSGDITGSAVLFTGGKIAGWTLSSDRLTGGDLQFFKDGTIKSSNYQSDLKGWMITSTVQNGYAEFENARIRGTLSTTVFEKEKVSAVGGQIIVSNSTTISGSAFSASEATMSVENASGWAENEVAAIKKVSPTGFSTEYVRIVSSSRINPSSDVDFTGALYVTRSFGGSETYAGSASLSPDSGSSASHNYEPGQVIVSTGRYISGNAPNTVGTGYVKINANPTNPATPYIDIVERTGSAIYDLELKARLGDLSGVRNFVSGGVEIVPTDPGFGLFTQNVFLSGKIIATSGRIGGLAMEPQEIYSGTGTYGNANTPFYVNSEGDFSLGDKLTWDQSEEELTVAGTINVTAGSGFATPASVSASFASPSGVSGSVDILSGSMDTSLTRIGTQLVLDSSGMSLKDASSNTLASYGTTVTIGQDANDKSRMYMDSDSVDLIVDAGGTDTTYASFGATTTVGPTAAEHTSISSTGIELKDASTVVGKFSAGGATIGSTGGRHVSASSTEVTVKYDSDNYTVLGSNSLDIILEGQTSASFGATTSIGPTGGNHVLIDSDGVKIKNSSTTFLSASAGGMYTSGHIHASHGTIGGFVIGGSTITGGSLSLNSAGSISLGNFSVDTSGNVTARGSSHVFDGNIAAHTLVATGSGYIGGFSIGTDTLTSTNVGIGKSGQDQAFWAGSDTQNSAPFRVTHAGALVASNATITGGVTATSGNIGSWTITGGYLYGLSSGTPTSSPTDGIVLASSGTGSLSVYEDAHKRVELGYLSSGVYGIKAYDGDASNAIFEVSDTQQRMAGFYFSNNDLWGGNATIGNSGTTIVLGNLDGTSKIALGASADAINLDDTGTGFYADGGGNMRVGSTTRHIKWDATDLHVKSRAFNIGSSATSFISGSVEGHLEISSSQFHVSGGQVFADISHLRRVSEADYFNYRSIVIKDDPEDYPAHKDRMYLEYSQSAGGTVYTAIILDGSQGGPAGAFVRFNEAPDKPIGQIVTPGKLGGHQVTFEGVQPVYLARAKGVTMQVLSAQAISQGKNPMGIDADPYITDNHDQDGSTTTYAFYSDTDDIVGGGTNNTDGDAFWSYDVTVDSVAHTDLARISSGNRIQFTKSTYDFRMTAISAYSDFTPNFELGIAAYGGLTAGLRYGNNGTYKNYTVGSVGATVNVVAYASDERLKENIEPFVCGSAYLDKIKPVEFDWNEKAYEIGFEPDQHHEIGFIAQELGEVLPQSIAPAPINKKDDDYLTVKEEKLIPILVSSLKEQRNEIADLKEDIKELKKVIKEL